MAVRGPPAGQLRGDGTWRGSSRLTATTRRNRPASNDPAKASPVADFDDLVINGIGPEDPGNASVTTLCDSASKLSPAVTANSPMKTSGYEANLPKLSASSATTAHYKLPRTAGQQQRVSRTAGESALLGPTALV